MNSIDLLKKWLIESDVFNKTGELKYSTNNGYSRFKKKYNFVYHEITGYSISLFVYLYKIYNNEKYLHFAIGAAKYLLSNQSSEKQTYGAFFHSYSLPNHDKREIYYTFDNFIIINGFMHLFSETKDKKYLNACIECANWLLDNMYNSDKKLFYARYDKPNNSKSFPSKDFAGDFGILHGKIAIPFLKLWKETKDDRYKDLVVDHLDKLLELQRSDGSFWANFEKKYVFTHAQCYITEGLLYAYYVLKNEKYLYSVKDSLNFLKNSLIEDGDSKGLKHIYSDKNMIRKVVFSVIPYLTTDATSQYIRLSILYAKLQNKPHLLDENGLDKSVNFIKNNQIHSNKNKNLNGSLRHKIARRFGLKFNSLINSTWCSQFALQALIEYEKKDGSFIENLF